MDRASRLVLATLAVAAGFALVSLTIAATNWAAAWRGLDQISMELGEFTIADNRDRIGVELFLTNNAGRPLTLRQVDVWARLSGRSLGGGSERFRDFQIAPGERARLYVDFGIAPVERDYIERQLTAGGYSWVAGGRISVVVDDLTEPVWLPFQWRIDST